MTLLHILQDIEISPPSRVTTDKAAENSGRGSSTVGSPRRPYPRKRAWQNSHWTLRCWVFCAFLVISSWTVSVDATHPGGRYSPKWRQDGVVEQHEEVLLDHGPTPLPSYGILGKRKDDPSGTDQPLQSSSFQRPSFASTAAAVDATAATAWPSLVSPDETPSTITGSHASPTSSPSAPPWAGPLPKPFDGGLGTNYTQQSCPDFLRSMLSNETFSSCLPLSLLLQNSVSFFNASRTRDYIDQTLAATCNVVFPACSALMASFAQQLRSSDNCEQDWHRQNHLVTQAYNGLVAYEPLYRAGCLKDREQKYCFADAITNSTSPSDSYVYYLPVGIPLPGASKLSCSPCLVGTMNIFQEAASNRSQPINTNYVDAAQMIDIACGPTFANTTLPLAVDSGESAASLSLQSIRSLVTGLSFVLGIVVLHIIALA